MAEAREILKNWQDKLNTRITRDAYLEANTPEILKDFLENWKQHAIGYYREKRIRFIEYLITYAGKSLGEKISRNRHGLDADGNPLPDPSGDTLNNEEAKG